MCPILHYGLDLPGSKVMEFIIKINAILNSYNLVPTLTQQQMLTLLVDVSSALRFDVILQLRKQTDGRISQGFAQLGGGVS